MARVNAGSAPSLNASVHAFTLIELLTVIGIIGILATLTLSGLSSAKKLSYQAKCTSQLRQLSLAMNMYLDDHQRRPPTLETLVREDYAGDPKVLICPADKLGDWGNRVNFSTESDSVLLTQPVSSNEKAKEPAVSVPQPPLNFSYLHPLQWGDTAWKRIRESEPGTGWLSCQLHGLGRQDPVNPSIRDFEGLILRGSLDGSVLKRQLFWRGEDLAMADTSMNKNNGFAAETLAPPSRFPDSSAAGSNESFPWDLFLDDPAEE